MSDQTPAEKQAILVAGYYRSGTSALCGSLTDLGVQILSDAESNPANPKGFFESTELIKFDIRVLELMRSYWSDVNPLPAGWIDRADVQMQREALAAILSRQFAEAPLVAVKHPHLCRLLPLYVQAVRDAGYGVKVLHTHRSPYAMATSQAKKNRMTRAHAIALWASYITSAEEAARGLPRAWVHYPDLLKDADATVRAALDQIDIRIASDRGVDFVTSSLNRSDPAEAAGLFRPLATLAAEIEAAIASGAGPDVWDDLRARSADLSAFVEELGKSANRAAPGVGQGVMMAMPGARNAAQIAGPARTHPIRPAERGDAAEQARLARLLNKAEAEAGPLPGLSVLIACPRGATERQIRDTLDSLAQNWHQPVVKAVFAVASPVDLAGTEVSILRRFEDDTAMSAALFEAMGRVKTDYAAILNAGDLLEPDAIARFTLQAAAEGADMIYSDEIAQGPAGSWIRAKPAMSLPRLLESCFVGDWAWYRRAAVATLGGFRPDLYPGAEEQDMQIRLLAGGHRVEALPEALFVRGEGTRRDAVTLEQATESARSAIAAHLATTGRPATVTAGALPGLFAVDHAGAADPAVVLGILCHAPITPEVAQLAVNRLLPGHDGTSSRIVFLRPRDAGPAMGVFLDRIAAEVSPRHPAISVRDAAPSLGAEIAALRAIAPGHHVALVDPVCAPSEADLLPALAAQLEALPDAGVIAPLVFYRDGERVARLCGPLLFGAGARIGEGLEAAAPGPGGWLATTQPVDAVDGPVVLIHAAAHIDTGATSWADLCAHLGDGAQDGGRMAYWTPRRQVEIPDPVTSATATRELTAARAQPYRGQHHHPAMSLSGSPLILEGRPGLVASDRAALVTTSGHPEDARLLTAARHARHQEGHRVGLVAEPVETLSILRAQRQGRPWLRLNPVVSLPHPGTGAEIPADAAIFSTLPRAEAAPVIAAARICHATSPRLAARLRGMGARDTRLTTPRLIREIWAERAPTPAAARPTVLWVEETGVDLPWIEQLVRDTAEDLAWTLVTRTQRSLPGNVATRPQPVFEEDWAKLFAETGASILLRPVPGANWCDSYLTLLGLAAGCQVLQGKEIELPQGVAALLSDSLPSTGPDRWIRALRRAAASPKDGTGQRDALLALPDVWHAPESGATDWLRPAAQKDAFDAA